MKVSLWRYLLALCTCIEVCVATFQIDYIKRKQVLQQQMMKNDIQMLMEELQNVKMNLLTLHRQMSSQAVLLQAHKTSLRKEIATAKSSLEAVNSATATTCRKNVVGMTMTFQRELGKTKSTFYGTLRNRMLRAKSQWQNDLSQRKTRMDKKMRTLSSELRTEIRGVVTTIRKDNAMIVSNLETKIDEVKTILQINIGAVKSTLQSENENTKMSLQNNINAMESLLRNEDDAIKASVQKDIEDVGNTLQSELRNIKSSSLRTWQTELDDSKSEMTKEIRKAKSSLLRQMGELKSGFQIKVTNLESSLQGKILNIKSVLDRRIEEVSLSFQNAISETKTSAFSRISTIRSSLEKAIDSMILGTMNGIDVTEASFLQTPIKIEVFKNVTVTEDYDNTDTDNIQKNAPKANMGEQEAVGDHSKEDGDGGKRRAKRSYWENGILGNKVLSSQNEIKRIVKVLETNDVILNGTDPSVVEAFQGLKYGLVFIGRGTPIESKEMKIKERKNTTPINDCLKWCYEERDRMGFQWNGCLSSETMESCQLLYSAVGFKRNVDKYYYRFT